MLQGSSRRLNPRKISILHFLSRVISGTKSCRLHILVNTHSADGENSSRLIDIDIICIWLTDTLFYRLRTVSYGLCEIIIVSLMDLRLTIIFTLRIRV